MKVCGQILVLAELGKQWSKTFWSHLWSQFKIQMLYFKTVQKIIQETDCSDQILEIDEFWASDSFDLRKKKLYCPLDWMCCGKIYDDRINHLQERELRTVYNENVSTFEKLLEQFCNNSCKKSKNTSNRALYKKRKSSCSEKTGNCWTESYWSFQAGFYSGSVKTVNCVLRALLLIDYSQNISDKL